MLSAKGMFEKLGYVQTEKNEFNEIQYLKKDDSSEMKRVGMISTTFIEFYPRSKEILLSKENEFRDGRVIKSNAVVLNFDEFKAVQKQISELKWEED